mgnify:FL=1
MNAGEQLEAAIWNDAGLSWDNVVDIGVGDFCAHIDDAGFGIIAGPVGNTDEVSFQVIDPEGQPVSDWSTYDTAERAVAEAELCQMGMGSHQ